MKWKRKQWNEKEKKCVYDHRKKRLKEQWNEPRETKRRQEVWMVRPWRKKGKRGSTKKENIASCNLPSLSLDEPFFPLFLFSIHPSVHSGFVYQLKKKGNRKCKQMELFKGAGHRRQDTGRQGREKLARWHHEKSFAALLLFSLFMLVASVVVVVYLCSRLKFVRPAGRQRRERTQDNGQWTKGPTLLWQSTTNNSNAWIWHSKRLEKKKKVVQFDHFVFRSQAFLSRVDYLSTLAKGEMRISGDTGIMGFIFWTDKHFMPKEIDDKAAGHSRSTMQE